jgi:hypothetical protein
MYALSNQAQSIDCQQEMKIGGCETADLIE